MRNLEIPILAQKGHILIFICSTKTIKIDIFNQVSKKIYNYFNFFQKLPKKLKTLTISAVVL
jgi:hypothetical protein